MADPGGAATSVVPTKQYTAHAAGDTGAGPFANLPDDARAPTGAAAGVRSRSPSAQTSSGTGEGRCLVVRGAGAPRLKIKLRRVHAKPTLQLPDNTPCEASPGPEAIQGEERHRDPDPVGDRRVRPRRDQPDEQHGSGGSQSVSAGSSGQSGATLAGGLPNPKGPAAARTAGSDGGARDMQVDPTGPAAGREDGHSRQSCGYGPASTSHGRSPSPAPGLDPELPDGEGRRLRPRRGCGQIPEGSASGPQAAQACAVGAHERHLAGSRVDDRGGGSGGSAQTPVSGGAGTPRVHGALQTRQGKQAPKGAASQPVPVPGRLSSPPVACFLPGPGMVALANDLSVTKPVVLWLFGETAARQVPAGRVFPVHEAGLPGAAQPGRLVGRLVCAARADCNGRKWYLRDMQPWLRGLQASRGDWVQLGTWRPESSRRAQNGASVGAGTPASPDLDTHVGGGGPTAGDDVTITARLIRRSGSPGHAGRSEGSQPLNSAAATAAAAAGSAAGTAARRNQPLSGSKRPASDTRFPETSSKRAALMVVRGAVKAASGSGKSAGHGGTACAKEGVKRAAAATVGRSAAAAAKALAPAPAPLPAPSKSRKAGSRPAPRRVDPSLVVLPASGAKLCVCLQTMVWLLGEAAARRSPPGKVLPVHEAGPPGEEPGREVGQLKSREDGRQSGSLGWQLTDVGPWLRNLGAKQGDWLQLGTWRPAGFSASAGGAKQHNRVSAGAGEAAAGSVPDSGVPGADLELDSSSTASEPAVRITARLIRRPDQTAGQQGPKPHAGVKVRPWQPGRVGPPGGDRLLTRPAAVNPARPGQPTATATVRLGDTCPGRVGQGSGIAAHKGQEQGPGHTADTGGTIATQGAGRTEPHAARALPSPVQPRPLLPAGGPEGLPGLGVSSRCCRVQLAGPRDSVKLAVPIVALLLGEDVARRSAFGSTSPVYDGMLAPPGQPPARVVGHLHCSRRSDGCSTPQWVIRGLRPWLSGLGAKQRDWLQLGTWRPSPSAGGAQKDDSAAVVGGATSEQVATRVTLHLICSGEGADQRADPRPRVDPRPHVAAESPPTPGDAAAAVAGLVAASTSGEVTKEAEMDTDCGDRPMLIDTTTTTTTTTTPGLTTRVMAMTATCPGTGSGPEPGTRPSPAAHEARLVAGLDPDPDPDLVYNSRPYSPIPGLDLESSSATAAFRLTPGPSRADTLPVAGVDDHFADGWGEGVGIEGDVDFQECTMGPAEAEYLRDVGQPGNDELGSSWGELAGGIEPPGETVVAAGVPSAGAAVAAVGRAASGADTGAPQPAPGLRPPVQPGQAAHDPQGMLPPQPGPHQPEYVTAWLWELVYHLREKVRSVYPELLLQHQ